MSSVLLASSELIVHSALTKSAHRESDGEVEERSKGRFHWGRSPPEGFRPLSFWCWVSPASSARQLRNLYSSVIYIALCYCCLLSSDLPYVFGALTAPGKPVFVSSVSLTAVQIDVYFQRLFRCQLLQFTCHISQSFTNDGLRHFDLWQWYCVLQRLHPNFFRHSSPSLRISNRCKSLWLVTKLHSFCGVRQDDGWRCVLFLLFWFLPSLTCSCGCFFLIFRSPLPFCRPGLWQPTASFRRQLSFLSFDCLSGILWFCILKWGLRKWHCDLLAWFNLVSNWRLPGRNSNTNCCHEISRSVCSLLVCCCGCFCCPFDDFPCTTPWHFVFAFVSCSW